MPGHYKETMPGHDKKTANQSARTIVAIPDLRCLQFTL